MGHTHGGLRGGLCVVEACLIIGAVPCTLQCAHHSNDAYTDWRSDRSNGNGCQRYADRAYVPADVPVTRSVIGLFTFFLTDSTDSLHFPALHIAVHVYPPSRDLPYL